MNLFPAIPPSFLSHILFTFLHSILLHLFHYFFALVPSFTGIKFLFSLLLSSLFLLFYLVSTSVDLILSPFNYITSAGSFCFCFYTYLTSSPRFVSFQLMLYSLGHISLLFSSSFSLALLPFVYPLLLSWIRVVLIDQCSYFLPISSAITIYSDSLLRFGLMSLHDIHPAQQARYHSLI